MGSIPGLAWASDDRCSEGQTRCGERCVNLQRNERHCGSCSNRCEEGEECVSGVCQGSCLSNGGSCTAHSQCCSRRRNGGTCAEPCPADRILLSNGTCATVCTGGRVPALWASDSELCARHFFKSWYRLLPWRRWQPGSLFNRRQLSSRGVLFRVTLSWEILSNGVLGEVPLTA